MTWPDDTTGWRRVSLIASTPLWRRSLGRRAPRGHELRVGPRAPKLGRVPRLRPVPEEAEPAVVGKVGAPRVAQDPVALPRGRLAPPSELHEVVVPRAGVGEHAVRARRARLHAGRVDVARHGAPGEHLRHDVRLAVHGAKGAHGDARVVPHGPAGGLQRGAVHPAGLAEREARVARRGPRCVHVASLVGLAGGVRDAAGLVHPGRGGEGVPAVAGARVPAVDHGLHRRDDVARAPAPLWQRTFAARAEARNLEAVSEGGDHGVRPAAATVHGYVLVEVCRRERLAVHVVPVEGPRGSRGERRRVAADHRARHVGGSAALGTAGVRAEHLRWTALALRQGGYARGRGALADGEGGEEYRRQSRQRHHDARN
eukprot:CAMPEP_0206028090 /NCGR_PEP_ID=MMETSP1464-20131121/44324_1 /ASSEMBLY_ACC=CAM_ASM_001124 /TAXON_ID=119497 /ORGANISM="Exanthemachrysis gayraliae, Strain RCC1523" /LENGTH=370 /DNA_ID=CAMNT_0053402139 /DNA_START=41 /DNA_END=1150 /DNA_ORIENTATION=+